MASSSLSAKQSASFILRVQRSSSLPPQRVSPASYSGDDGHDEHYTYAKKMSRIFIICFSPGEDFQRVLRNCNKSTVSPPPPQACLGSFRYMLQSRNSEIADFFCLLLAAFKICRSHRPSHLLACKAPTKKSYPLLLVRLFFFFSNWNFHSWG